MASKKYPNKPSSKAAKAPSSTSVDFDTAKSRRRVATVEDGRSIYTKFVWDNALRSETITQTRLQLEGGRPFDPRVQEANGTAWQCNVNFMQAAATAERVKLPFHKMVNDVPHKAAFTIDTRSPHKEKFQAAMAECFDFFLYDWASGYDLNFRSFISNYVNYGPGIVQFCDSDSPRYNTVNVERMYFPKNCRMCPDDWEVVALARDMAATELYSKIRDKKTAERSGYAGWNREAIEATIVEAAGNAGPNMPNYMDYTVVADMLVNNDISVTTPFQPITCVWLYVKQFDGKIGCYVFTQQGGVKDFLYEDEEAAESFRHLFGAVWYDTGVDRMVHSIKGFSIKNYFYAAIQNRMKSRFVDAATVSMGMNFQYADNNTPDETPPVENYGPFTIFPTGLNQLAVYPQLQGAQGVLEMLEQNQAENNSQYRQNQMQIAESDTATQANILANQQGQVTEAQASTFLSQFGENVLAEQFRRLRMRGNKDEDAKKFVKRMRDRQVPDEIIFDSEVRVRTGANAGMANPVLRTQIFQEGLALSRLPGVNGRWFLENLIANKYGADAVDKALLPEGEESEPVQRRQAIMENVDFGQGIMLPVAPTDAHFEHVQEHLKPLAGIIQGFRQNGQVTPEQASALVIALEHTGQHMSYLQGDETMKAEFQQVAPDFRLIQSVARGIITKMQSHRSGPVNGAPI